MNHVLYDSRVESQPGTRGPDCYSDTGVRSRRAHSTRLTAHGGVSSHNCPNHSAKAHIHIPDQPTGRRRPVAWNGSLGSTHVVYLLSRLTCPFNLITISCSHEALLGFSFLILGWPAPTIRCRGDDAKGPADHPNRHHRPMHQTNKQSTPPKREQLRFPNAQRRSLQLLHQRKELP